jgi:hypothetical protein
MEQAARVLNVVFWVAAALLVASLVLLDAPVVNAILMVAVVVSSGALAWYEFRLNPMADTERGNGRIGNSSMALFSRSHSSCPSFTYSPSSSSSHLRSPACAN